MSVYLDFNATTAIAPQVLQAMMPYLTEHYGNPSSIHHYGRTAHTAIETARRQVAALVGVEPGQVVFTSGGTEANNLALKGGCAAGLEMPCIAHSAIEHSSVLQTARALEAQGWRRYEIRVDGDGRIDTEGLAAALAADGLKKGSVHLFSVMLANNETGVLQDVAAISEVAHRYGALMHTDAVQAAGKIEVNFDALGVDLMSLSAHKIYGPKGVGALVFGRGVEIRPQIHGGGHERGLRAGTENLAGIVGFGAAAQLAAAELAPRSRHMQALHRLLEERLAQIAGVRIFAAGAPRLPNTTQLSVPGIDGETLLMQLDKRGIAVSSGSACSSSHTEPSHVLAAMGVGRDAARAAIRVSIGSTTTRQEIELFADVLQETVGFYKSFSIE